MSKKLRLSLESNSYKHCNFDKMQDLFRALPSDIMINIFSRLPLRSIPNSKCVCKPWLDLLSSPEFVKSYSPKIGPAYAVMTWLENSSRLEIFELEEGEEFENYPVYETESESETGSESETESEDKLEPLLTRPSEFPHRVRIEESVNGLLFLSGDHLLGFDNVYVCNPMTREFCHLEPPPEEGEFVYGLGAGRVTGDIKVVGIRRRNPVCYVHTLGSGSSWRRIKALPPPSYCNLFDFGSFINGNIYWLCSYGNGACCFDVETECFTTLVTPTFEKIPWKGDANIKQEFRVVRVYEEGDKVIYYPERTTNTEVADRLYRRCFMDTYKTTSMLLTPTLLSLKTLGMDNVILF
ncbi:hypothetical protein OROMI_005595 [Orobanche minor]